MKKFYILSALVLFALAATVIYSCKKDKQAAGCTIGGFDTGRTYVFYLSTDPGCGYVTVQVKNPNGDNVVMSPKTTSVFDTVLPSDPCGDANNTKRAQAELQLGVTYTYTASCNSKSWTGTITVPCDSATPHCNAVKIDK